MRCVSVRLDEAQHQRLRLRAAELGLSMGEYARRALLVVLDGASPPSVSRPERRAEGHVHRAVNAGPVPRCSCGAIRVDGEWRVP